MISTTDRAADRAADHHQPASAASPVPLGPMRLALLLLWAAASFGTCYFARDLQALLALPGLRLQSYGLAAQGILIVFIVLVVFNAWYFNRRPDGAPPTHQTRADDGV